MANSERSSNKRVPRLMTAHFLRISPIMACFQCQKAFKRPFNQIGLLPSDLRDYHPLCPECGTPMNYAGKKFKPPRKQNHHGWKLAEALIRQGYTFESHYLPVKKTKDRIAMVQFEADAAILARPPIHMRDVPAFMALFRKYFPR